MKTEPFLLAAPDFSALDRLARRADPAVLWPVGPQSLASHWLDHAIRLGYKRVVIHAADRAAIVRESLGDGSFWSLEIEVSPAPAPEQAIVMLGLPGQPARPAPHTAAGLLEWWLQLNLHWLAGRNPAAVSVDRCPEPGGWIAPRVTVHPSAKLTAPYWIGAGTRIGPDCHIGPHAVIGSGCLLERDVRLEHSIVLAGTFLGSHLDVGAKIVDGATLLDPIAGARVEIRDRFIASALTAERGAPAGVSGFLRSLWSRFAVSSS